MLSLLKTSTVDFLKGFKKFLLFEYLFLMSTSFIYVPLLAALFNRALRVMGATTLLNNEIFTIVVDLRGLALLLLIGILAVIIIFLEFSVLIILSQKIYFNKPITLVEAFLTSIYKIPQLFSLGLLQLMLLVLFLMPFIDMPYASKLVGGIHVPVFLMEKIANSQWLTLGYLVFLGVVLYLFTRWIFTIHCIVIETKSTREALKTSLRMSKNVAFKTFAKLLLLNLLIFSTAFIVSASVSLAPKYLGLNVNSYFIENYLLTMSGLLSYIFVLFLTPINVIFLTRLYYQIKYRTNGTIEDELVLKENQPFMRIEEKLFGLLRKKKSVVVFFLLLNLALTFQWNYALTEDAVHRGRNIYVIAHRGDKIHAPENSLAAIQNAINKGVDFVEIDVHAAKDGTIVLNHDINFERVAGVTDAVSALTLEDIKKFSLRTPPLAETIPTTEGKEEKVPTLEEALDLVKGHCGVIIDIKVFSETGDMAEQIVEAIHKKEMNEYVYIQSFNYSILQEIRSLDHELKIGQIFYFALGSLSALDVDFYTVEQSHLTNRFVRNARNAGREVFVWTVNSEENIKEVLRYDINGIISDYPEKVRELVEIKFGGWSDER